MAAVEDLLRFYVDESALGVGKALEIARTDVVYPGHRLLPEVPLGTLDPDWMPLVAQRGLVVICRDRHIRTKPAELEAFRAHDLRAFWIAGKRDLSNWDSLVRLVRRWPDIEEVLRLRGPGPWFYSVTDERVTEFFVGGPTTGSSRLARRTPRSGGRARTRPARR
jgi:hypothetical protein